MFNGVVNPFITSSQQHIFDHALSSFPPPHDHHHHQLLHVMADRSSSCCFNDYDGGPFDNTCCCNGRRSLFVQSSSSCKNNDGLIPIDHNNTSSALQRERSAADNSDYYYNIHHHDPWCSDEVVAPLKVIRSARKLAAEPGYKRGDEDMQWKKKYEEEEDEDEGKQLNQANPNSGKTVQVITKQNEQLLQQHKIIINGGFVEETPNNDSYAKREVSEEVVDKEASKNKRKRGRQRRRREEDGTFESSLKRCCEAVMNKMIAHQEELHKKLMEDIIRRDEENIAREESWKNQEMAKMREATEMRAKEQVHAEKKQAMIVEFLKKFTSSCHDDDNGRDEECPVTDHESRHQFSAPQNPSSLSPTHQKNDDIVCSKRTTSEDSRTSSLEKSPEPEAPRVGV